MSCFYKFFNHLKFFRRKSFMPTMNKSTKGTTENKTTGLQSCNKNKSIQNSVPKQAKFGVLPSPIKSESDKKEYKVIRLENGLTACLIADKAPINDSLLDEDEWESEGSDSEGSLSAEDDSGGEAEGTDSSEGDEPRMHGGGVEQKMAAAALCIGVGSFSDPKDVPGMAHFLEHMVFMGSEKYPSENDFDAFIKKGGGSDNASTDTETTCFYFECLEKNLYKALDKFAQFFIAPLMKKGAMTREREAIESEFQIALPSDSSRKEQLLCTLTNPNSPVNSFFWGNLITLRDNIDDDKLYEGVHEFRKRHYSAHRMTLAIQARLPMETLQEYVLECFASVPNNKLPADDFSEFIGKIDTAEFYKVYYVKPTKNLCQVELTWVLPPLRHKYKSKPHQYLSYLLGDEGKGSLLSYLRKKVWALGTSIGNGETGSEHNSLYALFTVTINLTDKGQAHLYEVIEAVFSYLNLIKNTGPQERIFNEIKSIADTSFRFSTEQTAVDLVEDLCESMQFYPPEDYIKGSELYYEYDPEAIKMVSEMLVPEKMNVVVLTRKLPDGLQFDKVEKWFGTQYTDTEIPEEWLNRWKNVEPFPELSLPPPNPYLTEDFSLLPEVENNPLYPEKIASNSLLELWYRQDQKFKLPIGYYMFYLISPTAVESAASLCMLDALVNLLVIHITEDGYPATYADLEYSFVAQDRGLMVKVSGYNEKLPILIDVIVESIKTVGENTTKEMFEAVKDKLLKAYYNKLLKPSLLSKDIRLNLLINNNWTPADRYTAMLDVTFEMVQKFAADYTKNLMVKSLVQGNISREIAEKTVTDFVKKLNCEPLAENTYPTFRVVQIPLGEKCCKIQSFNKSDSNSIITNYYQSGPFSIKTSVIIEIIMLIIEEPLFDILRTKEQLGYHVYCSSRDTFGILGYTITVNAQATKHTTDHVDTRIEEFIKHTKKILSETTEKELNQTKGDLIKMKMCTDVHLKEEVDRNWSEIVNDDYMFDRLKQEISVIESIKLDDIRKWWAEHNSYGNKKNFRKLSCQVVGYNTKEKTEEETSSVTPSEHGDDEPVNTTITLITSDNEAVKNKNKSNDYFIESIKGFKKNLFLYPVTQTKV